MLAVAARAGELPRGGLVQQREPPLRAMPSGATAHAPSQVPGDSGLSEEFYGQPKGVEHERTPLEPDLMAWDGDDAASSVVPSVGS